LGFFRSFRLFSEVSWAFFFGRVEFWLYSISSKIERPQVYLVGTHLNSMDTVVGKFELSEYLGRVSEFFEVFRSFWGFFVIEVWLYDSE
jgi:hypothetical protein